MSTLADILRPKSLDEFLGQSHLLGKNSILKNAINNDSIRSMILFGPSGTGKTTLAEIIANKTNSNFIRMNATTAKTADVREAINGAKVSKDLEKKKTLVAIDELHRFPKNIQDLLLPHVENQTLILIGITTQNPFHSVNHALISRSIIFEFKPLSKKDMLQVIKKTIQYYKDKNVGIDKKSAQYLLSMSGGDARRIITAIEFIVESGNEINIDTCKQVMPTKFSTIDKDTAIYDGLSALQGSIQASDVDGAIFWLGQIINTNGDIESVCRRLLVTASEDVGCCNPIALIHTYAAVKSALIVGLPEAKIILSSATAYLAMNPRSKAAHDAINKSIKLDLSEDIRIPNWLRDCHYEGCEQLGHGKYMDGQNIDIYTKFPVKLFEPVNGDEIDLMKGNEKLWNSR
ncbi:MAG: AAA family ATPase [Candidatus Lokiarchaeota archaeon]|nr:AAA family ATPase [Candidatus Lokiarchaeota archaeon]